MINPPTCNIFRSKNSITLIVSCAMMKLVANLVLLVATASAQDLPTDGVALAISGYGVINMTFS